MSRNQLRVVTALTGVCAVLSQLVESNFWSWAILGVALITALIVMALGPQSPNPYPNLLLITALALEVIALGMFFWLPHLETISKMLTILAILLTGFWGANRVKRRR